MGVRRALGPATALAVLAVGVAAAANPPRPTGGLVFGPATPVDAQRAAAALVVADDAAGGFWVGARPGLVHRSVDGGDTFHPTTALTTARGSVDIEVDERGIAYAAFRRGVDSVGTALSVDGGHTWGERSFPAPGSVDERVSVAVDGGNAGDVSDDTVFFAFRAAGGAFVYTSGTAGGAPYVNAARSAEPVALGERCGRLIFDPFGRRLYLPCVRGGALEIATAAVPIGKRSDLAFTTAGTLTESRVEGVPAMAADRSGNVYAVWVGADHNVHLAASSDGGATWGPRVQVSGEGAEANVLPVAVAGAGGALAIAWLGLDAAGRDPAALPALASDPRGAAAFRWYVFASLVTGAASTAPTVYQQRVTTKPVHYGRVCTDCVDGDPLLGDALGLGLERTLGAMTVVFPDTTDADHAAHLYAARQLEGLTALGRSIVQPAPANGLGDFEGDAPWPAFSPSGGGRNQPQLDLTRVEVGQPIPSTLRVRMRVASLANPAPPPGKAAAVWLTRFQVLGTGAGGEDVYRTLYVGAQATAGAPPTYFAGATACADGCALLQYPPVTSASGSVSGNEITVEVPLDRGFGAGVQLQGDRLLNVSAHTFGRDSPADVYADVDATRAFDYRLDQRIGPTTGRGKRITLRGTIPAGGPARASVTLDVRTNRTGSVAYRDVGARVLFRSTRITRVTLRRGVATISGAGLNATRRISFVATVVARTRGRDSFAIRLSSGYRRSGRLATGEVRIR